MKKRFWEFPFAVLAAYALHGAELVNRCTVMDAEGGRIGFQTRPENWQLATFTRATFTAFPTSSDQGGTAQYHLS